MKHKVLNEFKCNENLGDNFISTHIAFGKTGRRTRFAVFTCPTCGVKQEKLSTSSIVKRGGTCYDCNKKMNTLQLKAEREEREREAEKGKLSHVNRLMLLNKLRVKQ